MIERLNYLLNDCWGGIIQKINFDILNYKIAISIIVKELDQTKNYDIIFFKVSSFYFINEDGARRLIFSEPEYHELVSINYYRHGIGKIDVHSQIEDWVDQYYSNSNFAFETWNSMFFIEAESIQINDEYFLVSFPEK